MPVELWRDKKVIKVVPINSVRLLNDQLPHSLVVQINPTVFRNPTRNPENLAAWSLTRHHQKHITRSKLVFLGILTSIFFDCCRAKAESTRVIEISDVHYDRF